MTKEQVKAKLINLISEMQGAKSMELIAKLFNLAQTDGEVAAISRANVPELLEELVQEKKIFEIEYELASMPYRTKSFYLPARVKVKLRGGING